MRPMGMPRSGRFTVRAACVILASLGFAPSAPEPAAAAVVVLCDDAPGVTDLAAPGSGQTVYCLDGRSGAIVAIDPFKPEKRRTVVGPAAAGEPVPVAIACIDTSTLVAVCRGGDSWSVRTWRIHPERTAESGAALQTVPCGDAGGESAAVRVTVSRGREWVAISGLPPPLAPVLRAPIAGVRVGTFSDRGAPRLPESSRLAAAAVGPLDELIVFGSAAKNAAGDDAGAEVTFYGRAGQPLLRLDTGLQAIRGAACSRGDGTLWVLAADPTPEDGAAGLWRLDAEMRDGRQAIRPTCVARLAEPRAVVGVAKGSVVVSHGADGGTLVRIDPDPSPDQPQNPGSQP